MEPYGAWNFVQDHVATMDEFIKIAYSIQKTKAMINAILDYLKSGNVNPDGTVRYVLLVIQKT